MWRSRHVSPSSPEGISLQTTVTVNVSEAKTNPDLDKGVFQFTPLEKAEKVPHFSDKSDPRTQSGEFGPNPCRRISSVKAI